MQECNWAYEIIGEKLEDLSFYVWSCAGCCAPGGLDVDTSTECCFDVICCPCCCLCKLYTGFSLEECQTECCWMCGYEENHYRY